MASFGLPAFASDLPAAFARLAAIDAKIDALPLDYSNEQIDELCEHRTAALEALFKAPSRSVSDISAKLTVLWKGEIPDDIEMMAKQRVLADLATMREPASSAGALA